MTGDGLSDGYLVADEHGVVVDVNDVVCRLLAVKKDDLLGRSLASRDRADVLRHLRDRWPELRNAGEIAGSAPLDHGDGTAPLVEYIAQCNLPIAGWTMVRIRTSTTQKRDGSGVA